MDCGPRPGRYAGEDNGWSAALFSAALLDFDKSIMKYPSIQRFPGGASNDLIPDLQHPKNPLPLLDPNNLPKSASFERLGRDWRSRVPPLRLLWQGGGFPFPLQSDPFPAREPDRTL